MNFFGLSEKLNSFLYKNEVRKLTPEDLKAAKSWTLEMIRERNPNWPEGKVRAYYENLMKLRVRVVDEYMLRAGIDPFADDK